MFVVLVRLRNLKGTGYFKWMGKERLKFEDERENIPFLLFYTQLTMLLCFLER